MPAPTDLDSFLASTRIEQTTWEQAAIDWKILLEIANDHENQLDQLVILPFCKGRRSRNITQPWPTAV